MTISKLEAGMDASNNNNNPYAKLLKGSWIAQFLYGSNPWMARYVYSVMFLLANLLAWAVRDYGPTALTEMNKLKSCKGGDDCLGTEGVLRVSLGCFMFYFTMFLSTTGPQNCMDKKNCGILVGGRPRLFS